MGSRSRKWTNDDEDSDEELNEFVGSESPAVGKLGKSMEKSLYVDKADEEEEDESDEEVSGNVFGHIRVDEFKSEGERLSKHVAFPSPGDLPPSGSSDEEFDELGVQPNINHSLVCSESEDEGPTYVCEIYLPDPSSLVPAVRGSREKQGSSPKERRVSWSPEVYDPIPKEVSYAVKSKQKKQPKSEKKTGKEKQKGNKASKASITKDTKQNKKQTQKNAGSSRRGQKSSDADFW
ncbi:hypothetical protein QQ045_015629 [Rhodiola kirilowii]